jgi:hypothetical protein
MKSLILAAASAVALGIGGVGVGHAALMSTLAPSSSSGYGMPATPKQMAPEFLLANSSSGQNLRAFGYRVPQQLWAKYEQFNQQWHAWACC